MFISKDHYNKMMDLIDRQAEELRRAEKLVANENEIIFKQLAMIRQLEAALGCNDIEFPETNKEGGFNS